MFKLQLLAALMFGVAVFSSTVTPSAWANSKKNKALTTELADSSLTLTSPAFPGVPLRNYSFTLKQLGVQEPFQLRGIDPIYSVPFSIPADEVVTAVKLKLDFSYSPSLLTNYLI